MRVKYIYDIDEKLDSEEPSTIEPPPTGLTLNKEYVIYGMCCYNKAFKYLIQNDNNKIYWHHQKLFEITNPKTPGSWHVRFFYDKEDPIKAIWGYTELVNTNSHNYDLQLDITEDAKKIFYKRKKEIDKEERFF